MSGLCRIVSDDVERRDGRRPAGTGRYDGCAASLLLRRKEKSGSSALESATSLFAIALSSRRISDHAGLPLPTGDHAIGILAAELDPLQPSGDPRVWGDAR